MDEAAAIELLPPARPVRRPPAVENEVLAMMIFVVTEVMFFAGLISAHTIISSRAPGGIWPPAGEPMLPVRETAWITLALLLSGVAVAWAGHRYKTSPTAAVPGLTVAGALAALFVGAQVWEATHLIREGLTLVSSAHGGFFYTIVGAHALHTVIALLILGFTWRGVRAGTMSPALFQTVRIFWYFVVGLWPFLYAVVYL